MMEYLRPHPHNSHYDRNINIDDNCNDNNKC